MSALGLFAPRRLWRLMAGDAINIARDPMLLFAAAMSLLPALGFYLGRSPMDAAAEAAFGIASVSRYVAPIALLMPAVLIGWVTGFLLLEDRDEGTLLALDVTPVGKSGFLLYRTTVTAVLTMAITLYGWPLIVPEVPASVALGIAGLVAINAVAFAVVLPAIARNKVEGLALTKLTTLFSIVPLVSAVPSPLRYLAGVVPSYWLGETLHLSGIAVVPTWLAVAFGLLVGVLVIRGLFRLLARRAG